MSPAYAMYLGTIIWVLQLMGNSVKKKINKIKKKKSDYVAVRITHLSVFFHPLVLGYVFQSHCL